MGTECYTDASGCIVCPEVQEVPAQPAVYQTKQVIGWGAGANSVSALTGDVHAVFDFNPVPLGVVIGFKASSARLPQDNPNLIQHGFYAYLANGAPMVDVMEAGKRPASFNYTPGQSLEIRRVGEKVVYLINGTQVYASMVPSFGTLIVNACLYASGDTVP